MREFTTAPRSLRDVPLSHVNPESLNPLLPFLPGEAAHVVLPAGTWGEKTGTVVNAFGHDVQLNAVMPPPGTAHTDADILNSVLAELGAKNSGNDEPPQPTAPTTPQEAGATFFAELDLYLRLEAREDGAREMGTHWLFPESNAAQSGDGWLTGPLSWPAHSIIATALSLPYPRLRYMGSIV